MTVGKLSQNRRREELHDRIHRDKEAKHDVAGAARRGAREQIVRRRRVSQELRNDRHQDADAERVENNRENNDPDRLFAHRQLRVATATEITL
jgi:hypothetical protein